MSNHETPVPTTLDPAVPISSLRADIDTNTTRLAALRRMHAIASATPGLELHAEGLADEIVELEEDSALLRRQLLDAGDGFFGLLDRPGVDWVLFGHDGELLGQGPAVAPAV